MAYYVYVLRSLKNNKRYTGCTGLPPDRRLAQHNSGSNKWSKGNKPFELVYVEEHPDKTSARKRENFLKTGVGRQFLDNALENMVGVAQFSAEG